jgi:hypothetical protein
MLYNSEHASDMDKQLTISMYICYSSLERDQYCSAARPREKHDEELGNASAEYGAVDPTHEKIELRRRLTGKYK